MLMTAPDRPHLSLADLAGIREGERLLAIPLDPAGIREGERLLAIPLDPAGSATEYEGLVTGLSWEAREVESRHGARRFIPRMATITLDDQTFPISTTDFWRMAPDPIDFCAGCGAPPYAPCDTDCPSLEIGTPHYVSRPTYADAGARELAEHVLNPRADRAPSAPTEQEITMPEPHLHTRPLGDLAGAEPADAARDAIRRGITEPVHLDGFGDDQDDLAHLSHMSPDTLQEWARSLTAAEAEAVLGRIYSIRQEHYTRATQTEPIETLVRDVFRSAAASGLEDTPLPAAKTSGAR